MQLNKETVYIGENEYKIQELTCTKRDGLLDIIGTFTFAEIMKSMMPLLDTLGTNLKGDDSEKMSQLIKIALQNEDVWGSLMACVISMLHIGPQVVCLSLDKLDEEIEKYVIENLTVSQEPIILKQILKLNKLPETVGNYKSLLTEVKLMMGKTNS